MQPGTATNTGDVTTTAVANRHIEGVVLSFADGHTQWYKTSTGTIKGLLYKSATPFSISGNAPTFRAQDQ